MIEIAENISYRMRTPRHRFDAAAFVGTTELSMDAPKPLGSITSSSATTVSLDLNRGIVSLARQRRVTTARAALADAAHEADITLTKAIALRARMAECAEDYEAAQHLVRRRYAWRGYDLDDPEEAEASLDPASGNRIVFVAKDDAGTVGTITLGLDNEQGLLAEGSYADAVRAKRAAGRRVCEVTRLAVAEHADSKPVLASLFSLAFATASIHGVTDVFVEVNPRHVVFYRRVLGFVVAAGEKFCERVKAPSVLLWLTMDDLERHLLKLNARVAPLRYASAQAA